MKTILLHEATKAYEILKPYLRKGKTLVTCQRPVPSEERVDVSFSIGYGRFYGVGDLEEWKDVWEELDARKVEVVSNVDIEKRIEKEVLKELGIPMTQAMKEHDVTIEEMAEMYHLPYFSKE